MPRSLDTDKTKLFSEVYLDTYGKLYTVFLKLSKDEHLTKDILQQAYIKLWDKWDELTDKGNLSPLIYTYAKNIFINELKKIAVRRSAEQAAPKLQEDNDVSDPTLLKEYIAIADKVISNMPARRKEVYRLSRVAGLSHKKIAELLSLSPNTVERHIQDALKSLKKELKPL